MIDTDFSDFLNKKNLMEYQKAGQKIIFDEKYDLHYPHEISNNLEIDYIDIQQKYNCRIKRFREAIKEKTCFIRAVKDDKEILYIQKNYEYIINVITKANRWNKIVFLVPQDLNMEFEITSGGMLFFRLKIKEYLWETREQLRGLFESNKEFISFCEDNMDELKRKNNTIFDLNQEIDVLKKEMFMLKQETVELRQGVKISNISEKRYQLLLKLEKADFKSTDLPQKIIIYGAGNIGRIFYEKIKTYCRVVCFIDIQPKLCSFDDVPVLGLNEFDYVESQCTIIVTPTYDYDYIKKCLCEILDDSFKIVSLDYVVDQATSAPS